MKEENDKYLPIPALEGAVYVVAGKNDDAQFGQVVLGGDPKGLKSLGKVLIAVAELDQTKSNKIPNNESIHIHLYAGEHIGEGELKTHNLIISRLDMKNGKLKTFYNDTLADKRLILEKK